MSTGFRVAARTLLHLGRDLISSDAVAIYELVKNAKDAGSPSVRVDINTRVDLPVYRALRTQVASLREALQLARRRKLNDSEREELRSAIMVALSGGRDVGAGILEQLERARDLLAFERVLDELNTIRIEDSGHGMSKDDLERVYLVIGTPSRLRRPMADDVPDEGEAADFLGEKGIGRLSTMRLGDRLRVRTTKSGERYWNELAVDWRAFDQTWAPTTLGGAAQPVFIEDIVVAPTAGGPKSDRTLQGTLIEITALRSEWDLEKVRKLVDAEFGRFQDPFEEHRFPINLKFNKKSVPITRLDRVLFKHAHGGLTARYIVEEGGPPRYEIKAWFDSADGRVQKSVEFGEPELLGILDGLENQYAALRRLGPFNIEVYWFNRKLLMSLDGVDMTRKQVQDLVKRWAGGIMVFRDGYRVLPYGTSNDDWLDLDHGALSGQAYRVNRAQLIGRATISRKHNPYLVDQTNREGLRDCPEKEVLRSLLKQALEGEFRKWMDADYKAHKKNEALDLEIIRDRILEAESKAQRGLIVLLQRYPEASNDPDVKELLNQSLGDIRKVVVKLEAERERIDLNASELMSLAGWGKLAEMLAHELHRATQNALDSLDRLTRSSAGLPAESQRLLRSLRLELDTLHKRIKNLDPASTAGRYRKSTFDVVHHLQMRVDGHQAQYERHGIMATVSVVPDDRPRELKIKAVEGHLLQITENLLDNSKYWLGVWKRSRPSFEPRITITVDTRRGEVHFMDNGPGVQAVQRERIFEAFYSTKPAGKQKGLGLYIARELATYNEWELFLSDEPTSATGQLSTFILRLSKSNASKEE